MFGRAEPGVLRMLENEQVRQVLRIDFSFSIMFKYNTRSANMPNTVFSSKKLSPTLIVATCYRQLHLRGSR